MTSQQKLKTGW